MSVCKVCVGGCRGDETLLGRLEKQEGLAGWHSRGGRQYKEKQPVMPGNWGRDGARRSGLCLLPVASLTFFFPPSSWPCLHQVRTQKR